jgi:hypothetical protein
MNQYNEITQAAAQACMTAYLLYDKTGENRPIVVDGTKILVSYSGEAYFVKEPDSLVAFIGRWEHAVQHIANKIARLKRIPDKETYGAGWEVAKALDEGRITAGGTLLQDIDKLVAYVNEMARGDEQ